MPELYRIKRATPLAALRVRAYALIRVGGMMPREEHNEVLPAELAEIPNRAGRRQDRVCVVSREGSECGDSLWVIRIRVDCELPFRAGRYLALSLPANNRVVERPCSICSARSRM